MDLKNTFESIMIVDDSADDIYITEYVLQKTGITSKYRALKSGQEALNQLIGICTKDEQQNSLPYPDLILLDINMPIFNGFDFLEEFKELVLKKRIKKQRSL